MGLIGEELVTKTGRGKRTLPEDLTIGRILQLSQFIKRGIDLWVNIPQAMNIGVAAELLELYEDLDPEDEGYDAEEKEIAEQVIKKCEKDKDVLIKAYKGILELLQLHRAFIENLSDGEKLMLWQKVNTAAEQGRNNNTASLKKDAHAYVLKTGHPDPPLSSSDDKSGCGISHPQLLRMIVPMSILKKHGSDDDFEDKVKAKKYKISHKSAPAFTYDVDAYEPEAPEETVLRGHYPLRVLRHIFTLPSSAMADLDKKGKATRAGNTSIVGQREVTPEMIAYVCVQAWFYISKLRVFGPVDEKFKVKKFYYGIIKLFNNRDSLWVQDTLEWWNKRVFGDLAEESEGELESDDESNDEMSFANLYNRTNETAEQPSQTQFDSQYSQVAFPSEA